MFVGNLSLENWHDDPRHCHSSYQHCYFASITTAFITRPTFLRAGPQRLVPWLRSSESGTNHLGWCRFTSSRPFERCHSLDRQGLKLLFGIFPRKSMQRSFCDLGITGLYLSHVLRLGPRELSPEIGRPLFVIAFPAPPWGQRNTSP